MLPFQTKLKIADNWWWDNEHDFLYSLNENIGFIQYGTNRSDFASTRFCFEKVTWTNENLDSDGNITADVNVEIKFLVGKKLLCHKQVIQSQTL